MKMISQRKIYSVTGLFLTLWVTFLFTVVIPAHHHGINDEHDEHVDCVICLIACQPFIAVFLLAAILPVVTRTSRLPHYPLTISFRTVGAFDSRAPPGIRIPF